jgi:hypothetical protein
MATVVTASFLSFPQADPATMTGGFNPAFDVRAFRCGIAAPPKASISAH